MVTLWAMGLMVTSKSEIFVSLQRLASCLFLFSVNLDLVTEGGGGPGSAGAGAGAGRSG